MRDDIDSWGFYKQKLLGFCPVFTSRYIDCDRWYLFFSYVSTWFILLEDSFHSVSYEFLEYFSLSRWYVEYEFIMYLQYHPSLEISFANLCINLNHRYFDDICCSSLNRHIHRFSLWYGTYSFICIIYSGYISPTSEVGLDISIFPCIFEKIIIVYPDSWVLLIERIYIFLCLPWTTIQCLRETKSCNPIYHTKIHTLRYTSLFWCSFPCCFISS